MTVPSTTNKITYTGNGVLTVYAYTFKIFADTDLEVYLAGVLKTLNTDYTVSGALAPGGGNVTFTAPPGSGVAIIIQRVLPLTQLTDYVEGDPFPADSHEDALDKLTMIDQQTNRRIDDIVVGEVDHGLVLGLGDDDHPQYALLAGRAGGQTINLGLNSGDNGQINANPSFNGIIKTRDKVYIDPTNLWDERNALLTIQRNIAVPTVLHHNFYSLIQGKGDNTTLIGVCGGFFNVRDRSDVVAGTKGLLYGLGVTVGPIQDRDNSPYDDVTCLVCSNSGSKKGTDAICIQPAFTGVGSEWIKAINIDVDCDYGIAINGAYTLYGIDLKVGTYGAAPIRLPNNSYIVARKADDSADQNLIGLNASDQVSLPGLVVVGSFYTTDGGFIAGDGGSGIASTLGLTDVVTAFNNGTGSQAPKGVTGAGNPVFAGWLKIYVGTDIRYVPYYSTIQ